MLTENSSIGEQIQFFYQLVAGNEVPVQLSNGKVRRIGLDKLYPNRQVPSWVNHMVEMAKAYKDSMYMVIHHQNGVETLSLVVGYDGVLTVDITHPRPTPEVLFTGTPIRQFNDYTLANYLAAYNVMPDHIWQLASLMSQVWKGDLLEIKRLYALALPSDSGVHRNVSPPLGQWYAVGLDENLGVVQAPNTSGGYTDVIVPKVAAMQIAHFVRSLIWASENWPEGWWKNEG